MKQLSKLIVCKLIVKIVTMLLHF